MHWQYTKRQVTLSLYGTTRLVLSGETICAVNGYTYCLFRVTNCAGATKYAVTRCLLVEAGI